MGFETIVGAVASSLISGLFGGDEPSTPAPSPAPQQPKVEPVTPMPTPTPNNEAVKEAKRKSIAAITARQGRASTILTGNEDSTGGGGSTLGG